MKKIYLLFFICCTGFKIFAQPAVTFSPVITSGLTLSLDVVNAHDGSNRLFIVQQNGLVKIDSAGTLLDSNFLDVSNIISYEVSGERGLISLAFHPDYATNGYFFIYYNDLAGNIAVAQYRVTPGSPNKADAASGKVLLSVPKPTTIHNGGKLNFGPDGNLYFAIGDGGPEGDPNNNAQNGQLLLGKMLRINVDNFTTAPYYTIPSTNPFIGSTTVLDSIFALGLRNPYRWSFDRLTGDMWIADVGQDTWEEINYRTPANMSGVNYGWRCYEGDNAYDLSQCGTDPATGKVFPIFEYEHNAAGGHVVTGGYVYRGSEFPSLYGYYICCDYLSQNGWLIKPDGSGGWAVNEQPDFPQHIAGFGEAENGSLYALSLDGILYKVNASVIVAVKLISFTADNQNGKDLLKWTSTTDASLTNFEIQRSTDAITFTHVGTVASQSTSNQYQFYSPEIVTGTRYYRLKMSYSNGSSQYSTIVKIDDDLTHKIVVHYNGTKQLQLSVPYLLNQINVLNSAGQTIATYANVQPGSQTIDMNKFAGGVYWLQCISDRTENIKVIVQ